MSPSNLLALCAFPWDPTTSRPYLAGRLARSCEGAVYQRPSFRAWHRTIATAWRQLDGEVRVGLVIEAYFEFEGCSWHRATWTGREGFQNTNRSWRSTASQVLPRLGKWHPACAQLLCPCSDGDAIGTSTGSCLDGSPVRDRSTVQSP